MTILFADEKLYIFFGTPCILWCGSVRCCSGWDIPTAFGSKVAAHFLLYSKSLQPSETIYSTFTPLVELLLVYLTIHNFCHALSVGSSIFTLIISCSCMLSRQNLITIQRKRSNTLAFSIYHRYVM